MNGLDASTALRLWNATYPERYRLDREHFRQMIEASPMVDLSASSVTEGAAVIVKRSPTPSLYSGQNPASAHLSWFAFTDSEAAKAQLRAAEEAIRPAANRLVFGQDARHLLPGCPHDCDTVRAFLLQEGFTPGGEVVDLERDMLDFELKSRNKDDLARSGAICRPGEPGDLHLLREFFAREFPGRWEHDVLSKIEIEGSPAVVHGLFVAGACEGFALTQWQGCALPVAGAAWRLDLGENWCALGPIGVSKRVRGMGLGDALLGHALNGLSLAGHRRCIIDWTNLASFYEGQGFQVSRRYLSLSKNLDPI